MTSPPRHRLRPHVVAAVFIGGVDAVVLGQGAIALLTGLVMGLLGLVHVGRGLARDRCHLRHGGSMLAIYGSMVAAVFALLAMNNRIAGNRADRLVAALEAYRARRGEYPPSLGALVPDDLPAVPRAKYTVAFGEFAYSYDPKGRSGYLGYVTLPPFGRRVYSLETRRWGSVD